MNRGRRHSGTAYDTILTQCILALVTRQSAVLSFVTQHAMSRTFGEHSGTGHVNTGCLYSEETLSRVGRPSGDRQTQTVYTTTLQQLQLKPHDAPPRPP